MMSRITVVQWCLHGDDSAQNCMRAFIDREEALHLLETLRAADDVTDALEIECDLFAPATLAEAERRV